MDYLHYNDFRPDEVDEAVLSNLHTDGGVTFSTLCQRLRENFDWRMTRTTGDFLLMDSLKRLHKARLAFTENYRNHPMLYSRRPNEPQQSRRPEAALSPIAAA